VVFLHYGHLIDNQMQAGFRPGESGREIREICVFETGRTRLLVGWFN
jgi:hypothetical protein